MIATLTCSASNSPERNSSIPDRDAAVITRTIRLASHRYKGIIAGINGYDRADLAQDSHLRVLVSWPSFDPLKSRINTWVTRIVHNVAVDRARSWGRKAKKHEVELNNSEAPAPDIAASDNEDMLAWVDITYARLRHNMPGRPEARGIRKDAFTPAQLMLVAMLKNKLGLSFRKTKQWMEERPRAMAFVGLKRVPSHVQILLAVKQIEELKKYLNM